ncbi:hypothetical protein MPSEU_000316500 [Mayamaea pseudoterrestris]|nr:hypothetical protein MPSEU_000316500 [Mayamaea pseudoterrestris]
MYLTRHPICAHPSIYSQVKQEGATSLLKWMCGVEDVLLPVASLSQQSLNSSLTMKRDSAQHSHPSPPAWISQPSPRQKRKARALRSYSLPTTVQEHAFVTIHRQPFEPTLQQYYSTPGLMIARPTLPTNVWQVQQHVPMPVPHYTVGSYHHCSQPQLACSAGETVISSVSTTLPAHHGQLPMQVPYTPSLNASIAYVPVIQYHPTPITTPCPTASARPFRQSPTTLVGSTAENAEEINDSEDEERVGQIRSNDDDQLFPRLEPSHSRLSAGEGFYTPHGTPNDRRGGKPVPQRSTDSTQTNQQLFGLESHVKIGQEDDMPLPIDHEASWEISTLTDVENGLTHQTAPADLNGSGNFTPIDGDGLTGESLESFLRECPQELFENLKP